ncbi:MAG: type II toxin-antitoxin system VapC family toxin [Acidimicrobiales bacterium]
MIVDSSALIAVVMQEPGFETLVSTLVGAESTGIGTPTLTETGIVLAARLGSDCQGLLLRLLEEFEIAEVPFGERHWREALRAWSRFGRGRHPANLNFGDCMSYAVARLAGEPLLFVGNDFAATDLRAA